MDGALSRGRRAAGYVDVLGIRELQNLIERSVILSKGPVLQVPLSGLNSSNGTSPDGTRRRTLREAACVGTEWRGRAPGDESLDAPVPDEKAGNSSSREVGALRVRVVDARADGRASDIRPAV
jgi:DNA-binding NtrC family response regulator